MAGELSLKNRLRDIRQRVGLSQQELARAAGIARQTVGGIEAGTYAVSLEVAFKIARTLGCPVDELFWLDGAAPRIEARPVGAAAAGGRVLVAQVEGRWVAHSLNGAAAFVNELSPVDGFAQPQGDALSVELLDEPSALAGTVLLAGCAPAVALWARSAERWQPGLRVRTLAANSEAALRLLADAAVHAAGLHLQDNGPQVRAALGDDGVLVEVGIWDEGLALAPGNPKGIAGVAELVRSDIRIVNREPGAGCRSLLDRRLAQQSIAPAAVAGYRDEAPGHRAVAEAVAGGRADAGVTVRAVAEAFGLDFVPLEAVRYELALRKSSLAVGPVRHLLETLTHPRVRMQLARAGGYDTTGTGQLRAV